MTLYGGGGNARDDHEADSSILGGGSGPLESLGAMLEIEEGIELVEVSADAELSLLRLETVSVDVVLMDIRLPGMNGIEATRILKQLNPDIAVILLTAYGDEYLGEAIDAGASGYILKSCTRQQLVHAIRSAYNGEAAYDPSLTNRLVHELAKLRRSHRNSVLTARQLDVLRHVASGMPNVEIARVVHVSESTVTREMRKIFDRLEVNDSAHAVSEAYRLKLI